jgi:hypothetical protein
VALKKSTEKAQENAQEKSPGIEPGLRKVSTCFRPALIIVQACSEWLARDWPAPVLVSPPAATFACLLAVAAY